MYYLFKYFELPSQQSFANSSSLATSIFVSIRLIQLILDWPQIPALILFHLICSCKSYYNQLPILEAIILIFLINMLCIITDVPLPVISPKT